MEPVTTGHALCGSRMRTEHALCASCVNISMATRVLALKQGRPRSCQGQGAEGLCTAEFWITKSLERDDDDGGCMVRWLHLLPPDGLADDGHVRGKCRYI